MGPDSGPNGQLVMLAPSSPTDASERPEWLKRKDIWINDLKEGLTNYAVVSRAPPGVHHTSLC